MEWPLCCDLFLWWVLASLFTLMPMPSYCLLSLFAVARLILLSVSWCAIATSKFRGKKAYGYWTHFFPTTWLASLVFPKSFASESFNLATPAFSLRDSDFPTPRCWAPGPSGQKAAENEEDPWGLLSPKGRHIAFVYINSLLPEREDNQSFIFKSYDHYGTRNTRLQSFKDVRARPFIIYSPCFFDANQLEFLTMIHFEKLWKNIKPKRESVISDKKSKMIKIQTNNLFGRQK